MKWIRMPKTLLAYGSLVKYNGNFYVYLRGDIFIDLNTGYRFVPVIIDLSIGGGEEIYVLRCEGLNEYLSEEDSATSFLKLLALLGKSVK